MNCKEPRKWMSPYLDSELGATKTFEVSEHLRTCPECTARFEAERRADQTMRARFSNETMPEELWSKIAGSVSTPSWARVLRSQRYWAMAACLVLVVGGVLVVRQIGAAQHAPMLIKQFVAETPGNTPFAPSGSATGADALAMVLRDSFRVALSVPSNLETMGHRNFQVVSTTQRRDANGREFVEVRLNCCGEPMLMVLAKSADGVWPLGLDQLADDSRQAAAFDGVNVGVRDLGDVRVAVASRHSIKLILAALSQFDT